MNFTVYRSSAGSGKTYTLVKEYLRIVLSDPGAYRNILAITFTNKAANEMRDRIVNSLKEISDPDNHRESVAVKYMLPELEIATALDREELIKNANEALNKILHNYQDFSVGTIDSFIHRIIRTFAFDLHLPLNFEVEVDAKTMVSMAVDLLLSRVGLDEVPTKILKKYTESRIDDEKNWDIEKDLKGFSKQLMKDDIAEFLPRLHSMDTKTILAISEKLITYIKSFETELSRKAITLKSIWDANAITADDLSRGNSGIFGIVNRLANNDYSNLNVNSYVKTTLGDDKWCSTKVDYGKRALIDSLKSEMLNIATDLINYLDENVERYTRYKLLKRNIFPLAILNEIEAVLSQIRESEGIIHISEFDKRISDVVNNEPVPFIYERLGERYQHFLFDEFQDTSVLEWQNILPLIENALAEGKFNMIVGDAKQAIYRFKGGEVDQLVELPKIYKKPAGSDMDSREKILERNYRPESLKVNYRSRKGIIDFNNELYSFLAGKLPESLEKIYADCKQDIAGNKPGGDVRVNFIDVEGVKETKEPFYFQQIQSYVNEMVHDKGYSLRDIAILCRANNDASKIARNLLLNGIEVISAESLLLRSSPEVNFLVFCLDFISKRDDKIALAGMISYLISGKGNHKLHAQLQKCLPDKHNPGIDNSREEFYKYLKEEKYDFAPDELIQMGLYERLESLIRIFSLDKAPDPYIMFFLDAVFDYTRDKRLLPEDFTSYWRDNSKKYSIVVPEGLDAITVMTIHKAKGLEFPVVIYPFANSKVDISKDRKWVNIDDPYLPGLKTALLPLTNDLAKTVFGGIHEDEKTRAQLDMLNILYVATTRPTERLLIICEKSLAKSGDLNNIPSMIRTFLEHKDMWEDDKNDYVFGNTDPLPSKEKSEEDILMPEVFISGDWRENILLSGHAAEYWDLEDDGRNLEWGNLVHNILSSIHTLADIDDAISFEIIQGNLQKNEAKELKLMLLDILAHPDVKIFFDGSYDIRNEAAIMKKGGKEYRPDRLMMKDMKAIVLDYKTGKEDSAHIRQIESYGNLLEDMGYTDIERYLLYIDKSYKLLKV